MAIFFSSCFLSRIRLQKIIITKLAIMVFGLPLPILWHASIVLNCTQLTVLCTVRLIALHMCSTSSSRWSSDTFAGILWISTLFLLMYWSNLFLEISRSKNFSSRESILYLNFKFSAFKVSIIETFTLIKLSVTMSLMLALIFPLHSPRCLYKLSNFSFKLLVKLDNWVLKSFEQV